MEGIYFLIIEKKKKIKFVFKAAASHPESQTRPLIPHQARCNNIFFNQTNKY